MTTLPLAFSVLLAAAVLLGFIGLWRLSNVEDAIEARLSQYGGAGTTVAGQSPSGTDSKGFPGLNRALGQMSVGGSIANRLSRADVPLTVAEFLLIALILAAILGVLGWSRGGFLLAAVLGATGIFLPVIYLNIKAGRRRDAFTGQLPDLLTLLVGALRAGYGVTQAMDMLVGRMPKPASVEFARVMRAVNLGIPVNRALNDMADRAGSDDLFMIVTAVNVQAELGGNLAQILDTITETIRERIRIKREIRVLTAQQRMTGYLLAFMPIGFAVAVSLLPPGVPGPTISTRNDAPRPDRDGLHGPGWVPDHSQDCGHRGVADGRRNHHRALWPVVVPVAFATLLAVATALVWMAFRPAAPRRDVADRLDHYLDRDDIVIDEEFKQSFFRRAVWPGIRSFLRFFGRLLPNRGLEATRVRLQQAGNPGGLAALDFYGIRLLAVLAFGGLLLVLSMRGQSLIPSLRNALFGGILGFLLPMYWLQSKVRGRKTRSCGRCPMRSTC